MHAGLRIRLDGSGHSFLRLLTGVDSPPDEDRAFVARPTLCAACCEFGAFQLYPRYRLAVGGWVR
jgi:hypothetical protein